MARYVGYETPSPVAPPEVAFEASVATAAPVREIHVGAKEIVAIGVAGLALAACTNTLGGGSDNSGSHSPKHKTYSAKECDVLDLQANSAANPLRYNSTASLPHDPKIDKASGTNSVIYGWFGNEGPYGGKADKGSLAIIDTVIVDGALHTGNALVTDAEFNDGVMRHLGEYNTEQGRDQAIKDCNNAYDVLTQVGQYNPSAAHEGDHLTLLASTRDADNNINGVTEKGITAKGTMGGIEFKYRDTAKNVKAGFNTVLVTSDGNMYIEGIVPTANKPTPTPSPTPTSGASKSHNNQGQAENNNANNGGSAGGGNHKGVTKGNTPEKNPNGPTQHKGTGGSGPNKETQQGQHNSPSGGNTGGGSKPVPSPRQTGPIGPSTGPGPGPGPTGPSTGGGGGGGGETTPPTQNETTPPQNTPTSMPPTNTVSTPVPTPSKSGTVCDPNIAKC